MAAAPGNQNALGNSGGKTFNDRKLAAEVRSLTLKKIKTLFDMARVDMSEHDAELHDQILLKLAGTVLPRLTEVSGEDGEPIKFQPVKGMTQEEIDEFLKSKINASAEGAE